MPVKRTTAAKPSKTSAKAAPAIAQPPELTGKPCPICGKPGIVEMRPFCSKRCADVDLHRWLGGTYAIPAVETDLDGKDEDESED